MSSSQEKEFAAFGIINNKLKAGLLIGLLSLSLTANVYLVVKLINLQGELYEKMLHRADSAARSQADKILAEPVKNINRATARVDTATAVSIAAAEKADSAGTVILDYHKKVK